MNNDIPGKIYFSFIPGNMPKMLVPEIVLRLLNEQANTISKVKLNKIGFRVFV